MLLQRLARDIFQMLTDELCLIFHVMNPDYLFEFVPRVFLPVRRSGLAERVHHGRLWQEGIASACQRVLGPFETASRFYPPAQITLPHAGRFLFAQRAEASQQLHLEYCPSSAPVSLAHRWLPAIAFVRE